MKTSHTKWLAWAGFAFAAVTLTAWKKPDSQLPVKTHVNYDPQDTSLPRKNNHYKKEYKVGDLDRAMKELDRAMIDMNKNIKIDFSKMDKELKAAMEEVKNVDFEKIGREVRESMKKIDWDKTKAEINKAMREAEVQMSKVDKEEIEKEITKAKISSHIDLSELKRNVEKSLEGAKTGIEKARKELGLMKEFTDTLEKDGLINKKKGYKLEIKNGEFYINGTKQSKEVNDKYRKYFKDEDYSISSDGSDVSSI
jgi:Fe2+ transport system protein B